MTLATDSFVWDEVAYIRALEAGIFRDQRFELVEGGVWAVSIGPWHGAVAARVVRALPETDEWSLTMATLPSAGSLPDPDVWVLRRSAKALSLLGQTGRLARWSPADVALVVEVSDSSLVMDKITKTRVYGAGGYPVYWVVHREGIEVFTDPYEEGYRNRLSLLADASVTVPYTGEELSIATLLYPGNLGPGP